MNFTRVHPRDGCPGRMLLHPADQSNKHTSYSEVRVASQLFGGGARGGDALVDHRLREGCSGTQPAPLALLARVRLCLQTRS